MPRRGPSWDWPKPISAMPITRHEEEDDGLDAANRALALDPTIAEAHLPRAWHQAMLGRNDEAQAEIEMALRLNPDSWEANKEAARVYYRQGKLEVATASSREGGGARRNRLP